MYRIERTALPDGLRAVLHWGQNRRRIIYVSATLDAKGQRAAVIAALRASHHARWWTRLVVPLAMLLAGIRVRLGHVPPRSMARLAWAVAAVGVAVVVWAFVAAAPLHDGASATRVPMSAAARPQPPLGEQDAPGTPGGRHPGQSPWDPTSALSASRPSHQHPPAARSPGSTPSTSPSSVPPTSSPPSSSSPPPTPPPSSSPPPTPRPGTCVVILGVRVCVQA
jgi:hypothetical protein